MVWMNWSKIVVVLIINLSALRIILKKYLQFLFLRRCIQSGRCEIPGCSYGSYIHLVGRCPRKKEKMGQSLSWHRYLTQWITYTNRLNTSSLLDGRKDEEIFPSWGRNTLNTAALLHNFPFDALIRVVEDEAHKS
jgi:hypothetical protein